MGVGREIPHVVLASNMVTGFRVEAKGFRVDSLEFVMIKVILAFASRRAGFNERRSLNKVRVEEWSIRFRAKNQQCKGFQALYQRAKTRLRPGLSHMCAIFARQRGATLEEVQTEQKDYSGISLITRGYSIRPYGGQCVGT